MRRALATAPREARTASFTAVLVVTGLAVQSLVSTLNDPDHGVFYRVAAIPALAACAAGFLLVHGWATHGRHAAARRGLSAAVAAGALVLMVTHGAWSMLGLALAGVALSWRPGTALVVAALTCAAGYAIVSQLSGQGRSVGVFAAGFGVLMGAVLYALTRLTTVLHELQIARAQVARIEVDRERLRISRDLHDVIGRTLVAVAVRTQAAAELLPRDPAATAEQLRAVQGAIVDGQAQLRQLTSGPLVVSLADEVASSRAILRRVGVACTVDVSTDVPAGLDGLVATIVRESVTNVLKHSRPHACWITVRLESLSLVVIVANDGARETSAVGLPVATGPSEDGPEPAPGGTGLAALRDLVEEADGVMEWGRMRGDRFRVLARLPRPDTADPDTDHQAARR